MAAIQALHGELAGLIARAQWEPSAIVRLAEAWEWRDCDGIWRFGRAIGQPTRWGGPPSERTGRRARDEARKVAAAKVGEMVEMLMAAHSCLEALEAQGERDEGRASGCDESDVGGASRAGGGGRCDGDGAKPLLALLEKPLQVLAHSLEPICCLSWPHGHRDGPDARGEARGTVCSDVADRTLFTTSTLHCSSSSTGPHQATGFPSAHGARASWSLESRLCEGREALASLDEALYNARLQLYYSPPVEGAGGGRRGGAQMEGGRGSNEDESVCTDGSSSGVSGNGANSANGGDAPFTAKTLSATVSAHAFLFALCRFAQFLTDANATNTTTHSSSPQSRELPSAVEPNGSHPKQWWTDRTVALCACGRLVNARAQAADGVRLASALLLASPFALRSPHGLWALVTVVMVSEPGGRRSNGRNGRKSAQYLGGALAPMSRCTTPCPVSMIWAALTLEEYCTCDEFSTGCSAPVALTGCTSAQSAFRPWCRHTRLRHATHRLGTWSLLRLRGPPPRRAPAASSTGCVPARASRSCLRFLTFPELFARNRLRALPVYQPTQTRWQGAWVGCCSYVHFSSTSLGYVGFVGAFSSSVILLGQVPGTCCGVDASSDREAPPRTVFAVAIRMTESLSLASTVRRNAPRSARVQPAATQATRPPG